LAFITCDNGTTSGGISDDIVPGSSIAEKVVWLQANAESGGSYIIELNADESTALVSLYYGDRTDITVALRGVGANRTISLSSNDVMFSVSAGVTLVLDNNITLKGRKDNATASFLGLVFAIEGGTLVMNDGAVITGYNGFGVRPSGTFIMNGGTISGNARGGVYNWGTFTMNDGLISGNAGSGVMNDDYSNPQVSFTMNGGTISGNIAASEQYGYGGGVANFGSFTMSGGTITDNTASNFGGGLATNGTFSKTGGTITGSDSSGGNKESGNDKSSAVYAETKDQRTKKRRDTTSGPDGNLSYNGSTGAFTGAWD